MSDEKVTTVYRLEVEIPEGVDWEHPPQAWLDWANDIEWGMGPDDGPVFSWPQRRQFLTKASAIKMAERLRSYGATVRVLIGRVETWGWAEHPGDYSWEGNDDV